MGRRLFDIIDGPNGWNDDVGYGAEHAAKPPVFVVTARSAGVVAAGRALPLRHRRCRAAVDAAHGWPTARTWS